MIALLRYSPPLCAFAPDTSRHAAPRSVANLPYDFISKLKVYSKFDSTGFRIEGWISEVIFDRVHVFGGIRSASQFLIERKSGPSRIVVHTKLVTNIKEIENPGKCDDFHSIERNLVEGPQIDIQELWFQLAVCENRADIFRAARGVWRSASDLSDRAQAPCCR